MNQTLDYHLGDTFQIMAGLPDNSVDLILTSPPFLALRSYLPADHPDKEHEIGSEANPAAFVDTMLRLTAEWERLLTPHGTLAVELGDTYSGSGGAGGDYREGKLRDGQERFNGSASKQSTGWPQAKSLCMIPQLYATALAYGINPLTGNQSPAGQWKIRNIVRWVRPNPPVGALGDKFRPATSEMVIACKSKDRWFDLDAVRTEHKRESDGWSGNAKNTPTGIGRQDAGGTGGQQNPAGAPPLDWWNIPTQPYKGSHYATWPEQLCHTPIQAMCPRQVCNDCGTPRRRIDTDNWTDCGHDDYRRGLVLDPFAGSGTTLKIAAGLDRDTIGIDLDQRNADLAAQRIGPMFLTIHNQKATSQ